MIIRDIVDHDSHQERENIVRFQDEKYICRTRAPEGQKQLKFPGGNLNLGVW